MCGGAFDFLLDWSCWKIIDELRVKLIQHVRTIEVFIRIELHHLLLYFRLHFLNTCGLCFPLWQRCHRSDECFTAENVQLLCSRMKLGQARRLQGPAEVWIACFAVPFPGRSHRLSHTRWCRAFGRCVQRIGRVRRRLTEQHHQLPHFLWR